MECVYADDPVRAFFKEFNFDAVQAEVLRMTEGDLISRF